MQFTIDIQQLNLNVLLANAQKCFQDRIQDPSSDPMTFTNFFKDWQQDQFDLVNALEGKSTVPANGLVFCPPLTSGLKFRFDYADHGNVVESVRSATGANFTCPGYYSDSLANAGTMLWNGFLTGVYLVTLPFRWLGIVDLFSGLFFRSAWAQTDASYTEAALFACAVTQGGGSFLLLCVFIAILYWMVLSYTVPFLYLVVSTWEAIFAGTGYERTAVTKQQRRKTIETMHRHLS